MSFSLFSRDDIIMEGCDGLAIGSHKSHNEVVEFGPRPKTERTICNLTRGISDRWTLPRGLPGEIFEKFPENERFPRKSHYPAHVAQSPSVFVNAAFLIVFFLNGGKWSLARKGVFRAVKFSGFLETFQTWRDLTSRAK